MKMIRDTSFSIFLWLQDLLTLSIGTAVSHTLKVRILRGNNQDQSPPVKPSLITAA